MKVKSLIEQLEQMSPEVTVKLHHPNGEEVLSLLASHENECVWLESESDLDMGAELSSAFDHAISEGSDELDFYKGLLEMGITVRMVRKYLGNDEADSMKKICEKHGLLQESHGKDEN